MKSSLYLGGVYSWVCKHPPPMLHSSAGPYCSPRHRIPTPPALCPSQSDLMAGASPRAAYISKALKTLHLPQLTCALYLS